MVLGAEAQDRIAQEVYSNLQSAPTTPASGQAAVEKAADEGSLSNAEVAAPPSSDTQIVKIIGSRTFLLTNGVWVDTAFDPQTMQTVKVSFLSEAYFTLSAAHPNLAAAFALGSRVIAITDGVAYEVVESTALPTPIAIASTHTPAPTVTSAPTIQAGVPTHTPAPKNTSAPLSTQPPASGQPAPCPAGLIPMSVIPLVWLAAHRRRR